MMFQEENLVLIFQYLALIFLAPPVIILIFDRVTSYLAKDAFAVYSATGVVGTPVHELGHALACLIFGMRITKMKLYAPDRATGILGYVNFAYNPQSTLHAVGLVVQGIAPLLMAYGIFIVIIPWGPVPEPILSGLNLTTESPTYLNAIGGAAALVIGNMFDGARGFLWSVIALLIGMHAIPSWADIRIAVKGMFTLLAVAIAFSALSQIDLSFLPVGVQEAIYAILGLMLKGFFWFLEQMTYAVTMVTVVAVAGLTVFLLIPAIIGKVIRARKGQQMASPNVDATGGQAQVPAQDAILQAIGAMVVKQQLDSARVDSHPHAGVRDKPDAGPGNTTNISTR
ncbi:TPA: hypothetical protein RJN86_001064 [Pseudomonas aeruginosa]|jgi:hypothetical protein|nr:hypothetical protein [Pseudomonas aeruginosa]